MGTTICYACKNCCNDAEEKMFADANDPMGTIILCLQCSDRFMTHNRTVFLGMRPTDGQAYSGTVWKYEIDQFFSIYRPTGHSSTGKHPVCKKCHETSEFAEPNDDFVCYRCSH